MLSLIHEFQNGLEKARTSEKPCLEKPKKRKEKKKLGLSFKTETVCEVQVCLPWDTRELYSLGEAYIESQLCCGYSRVSVLHLYGSVNN